MAYAAKSDMIAAFGEEQLIQLTDRAQLGVIDDAVLNAALDSASAEIDAYVGRAAQLPLPNPPKILTGLTCTVARWKLDSDQPEGRVRMDYDDALAFLDKIAKGAVMLDNPAIIEPAPRRVRGSAAPPVFSQGGDWP
jgi:phage gp36-like protein